MHTDPGISHNWMRIGELSKKAGVSRYTIHYYYREGLLPPPLKTGRTMALYTDAHLECLTYIRKQREERGMPVAAIRQEVRLRFGDYWRSSPTEFAAPETKAAPRSKGKKQRQRIVEAAIELFSSKGYLRTHVSHVTDTLHISKRTFYLYFDNKHDLLVAVFDHIVGELTQTEQTIVDESDFFVRMTKRGEAYIRFYEKYHKILDIIRAESIGPESRRELSVQAIYRRILDPLEQDIRKAHDEGLISGTQEDSELFSYIVLGGFDLLCYRLLMDDKYSTERILDIFRRFLLVGISDR